MGEMFYVLIAMGIIVVVTVGLPFLISYSSGRREAVGSFRPQGEMWPWAYSIGYIGGRKRLHRRSLKPRRPDLTERTLAKIAKFEGKGGNNDY